MNRSEIFDWTVKENEQVKKVLFVGNEIHNELSRIVCDAAEWSHSGFRIWIGVVFKYILWKRHSQERKKKINWTIVWKLIGQDRYWKIQIEHCCCDNHSIEWQKIESRFVNIESSIFWVEHHRAFLCTLYRPFRCEIQLIIWDNQTTTFVLNVNEHFWLH